MASSSQSSTSHLTAQGNDSFFDIAPRSDSTSFQVGYLGLKGFQAWLKGDVLVKLDTETKSKGRYNRCIIQLHAKEEASGYHSMASVGAGGDGEASHRSSSEHDVVELFSHTLVLWDAAQEPTSSSAGPPAIPSTMPFSFPLTQDLPHCVHLRDSSLTYTVTAQLFSEDAGKLPHAVKSIPVHLVRYTRPGPLNQVELAEIDGAALPDSQYTLQPYTWIEQLPTLVYAQMNRTIFRRAEPIEIRVRIPSPDPMSVAEKGLKLRAVEADLVRIIHVKRSNAAISNGAESKAAEGTTTDPHAHEALLAHSGKLCRFHSKRPVLLRLALHPPFDRANMPHPHPDHDALASGPVFGRGGGGGCESISQETLMHKVTFEVRIKIGIQGGRGERRDIVLRRLVKILPGAAGALEDLEAEVPQGNDARSEKERLRRSEKARMLAEDESAGASSSNSPGSADDLLEFGMDDEYDGYEDVGRSLDDLMNAANEEGVGGSSSGVIDHAERLEQLRQLLEVSDPSAHNEGPPPTLLESQNDLQVEVEVEGVGLAMPRLPHRHPADPYPDTAPPAEVESYLAPPPIDATDPSSSYEVTHYAADHDDPPPPISPLLSRSTARGNAMAINSGSQGLHMPGGLTRLDVAAAGHARNGDDPLSPPEAVPGYSDLPLPSSSMTGMQHGDEVHPSYEVAMSGSMSQLRTRAGPGRAGRQYEPPPYADGADHADPVPSFDQAIRQAPASVTRSQRQAASLSQVERRQQQQQESPNEHSVHQSVDYHPPAYGTSPHPPSYDA